MDENERRRNYEEIIRQTVALTDSGDFSQSVNTISNLLKTQNEIFNSIETPTVDDLLLDLRALDKTVDVVEGAIRNLQVGFMKFEPLEFAQYLVNCRSGDRTNIDWLTLAETRAVEILNKVPAFPFMLGTFELEKDQEEEEVEDSDGDDKGKKRKRANKKIRRVEEHNRTTTDDVDRTVDANIKDKNVKRKVDKVLKILRREYEKNGGRAVQFFHFAYHPTDFAQTVDNLFLISFLLRDGLAGLERREGDEGDIFIKPIGETVEDEEKEDRGDDEVIFVEEPSSSQGERTLRIKNVKNNQTIFTVTIAEWKDVVEKLNITTAIIKF